MTSCVLRKVYVTSLPLASKYRSQTLASSPCRDWAGNETGTVPSERMHLITRAHLPDITHIRLLTILTQYYYCVYYQPCTPLISGCGQNFAHAQLWPYQFNTSSYATGLISCYLCLALLVYAFIGVGKKNHGLYYNAMYKLGRSSHACITIAQNFDGRWEYRQLS